MGKFTSKILSLVMALAITVMAVPVSVSMAAVTDENFEFVDMAYSSDSGMYVAMAKKFGATNGADKKPDTGVLYASPNGKAWKKVLTYQGDARNYIYQDNRQSVIWWESEKVFLAALGSNVYTSADGLYWQPNTALSMSNAMLATNGTQVLVFGGSNDSKTIRIADSLDSVNNYTWTEENFLATIAGMSKQSEDGSFKIVISNRYMSFDITFTKDGDQYQCTASPVAYPNFPADPVDISHQAPYRDAADRWAVVFSNGIMKRLSSATARRDFVVPEGELATAVSIYGERIMIGTQSGRLFYSDLMDDANTVWTEIPATGIANAEPVKNITFADKDNYVVLAKTNVFTGTTSGYSDITDYNGVQEPAVALKNPFYDVKLMSGTYSSDLGVYIVVGNEVNGGGVIFTSKDKINWEKTYSVADKFANASAGAVHGAVWWGAQNSFVVTLASPRNETGINCVCSADGYTWTEKAVPGLAINSADMRVVGDKLYTTDGAVSLQTYTSLGEGDYEKEKVEVEGFPTGVYAPRLAVSDDAEPAVLMTEGVLNQGYRGAVKSEGAWTYMPTLGGYGTPTDTTYSKNMGKFIVTQQKQGNRVSIVGKDGSIVGGPSAGGVFFDAVETNGSVLLFGGRDGALYSAADDAGLSSQTQLNVVPLTSEATGGNTFSATGIFVGASGEFIVTVSDGTDSDILVVDNAASEYWKVSDHLDLSVDSLKAGQTLLVSAESTNNTDTDVSFTMVTAIYDGNKLLQVVSDDRTMAAGKTETQTQEITLNEDIPETATMKVYMWDSLSGMQPVSESTGFFG